MKTQKTWIITGATSAISQAFAHLAAQAQCPLILVGRDAEELGVIAADLQLRYRMTCSVLVMDFTEKSEAIWSNMMQKSTEFSLFIAHSLILENKDLNPENIERLINTNITSTVQMIHLYHSKPQKNHELIFLSSVAACRGRSKNSLYGASKNAIEVYLQGLQQGATNSQYIQIARLGFIDTPQTYGVPGVFYAAPPKACAKACWLACRRQKRLIYYPKFWRWLMAIIKYLPFFIYRRLKI